MTKQQRMELAGRIIDVFNDWKLNTSERVLSLGLRPQSRAVLCSYRTGGAIGNRVDRLDRAKRLINIHSLLKRCLKTKMMLIFG